MGNWKRRLAALVLALALMAALAPPAGQAVLSDVYFTAANEELLELTGETMPFWSVGVLYVSSKLFEGTGLGVNYARNNNLAMLYTPRTDLRFDLEAQTTSDKFGNTYAGYAMERGGVVFFPLGLVCSYFGLNWSTNSTETVPLIRVTSSSAVLDDTAFLDAAAWKMGNWYREYEKAVLAEGSSPSAPEIPSLPSIPSQPSQPPVRPSTPSNPPAAEDPPHIQAAEGQKVYLIVDCRSAEDTKQLLASLDAAQATFLLGEEQLGDGDLVRGLVAGGHAVALRASGGSAQEVAGELSRARERLWGAACLWLELVWYEGPAEIRELLEREGCVRLRPDLDRRSGGVGGRSAAESLLRTISRRQEDLAVYLGRDSGCTGGLSALREALEEAGYWMCPWRLTA